MSSSDAPDIPGGPIETKPAGFCVSDEQATVLRDTLTAAGVELGAYDEQIVEWLAMWDWGTLAVIISWVARAAASRPPAPVVPLPGRFDATPAETEQHLRRILAEDVYLRFQQAIGGRAVEEAAKDLRTDYSANEADMDWVHAADHIDPRKGGGPYPRWLLCSQHDGFGSCPGAPRCTPKENS